MGKKNVVWNDYISKNERFADFINGVVFRGEQLVQPDSLTALDTKLRRRERGKDSYHEFIRDMAKVWEYQGKRYVLGLEPEETPHLALPVKYMNYESLEYDRQYKETVKSHRGRHDLTEAEYISGFAESDRLMPVITIGIYLGEKPWQGFGKMRDMSGMDEVPPEIRKPMEAFWNDFRINLLDIHSLESGDVFRTDLREVFGFLKRQGNKEDLIRYVEKNEVFQHLQEDAFDVLSSYGGNVKLELNKEDYRTKEGMDMCTALRELEEDARAEGRAEGRREGRAEGRREGRAEGRAEGRREGRAEGRREGRAEGREEGSYLMNELNRRLIQDGRTEDLFRSIQDIEYQKELMEEYGLDG